MASAVTYPPPTTSNRLYFKQCDVIRTQYLSEDLNLYEMWIYFGSENIFIRID